MRPDVAGLRIGFIAGTLGQGGAERQLYLVLRYLVAAGARPRVLALTAGEYWEAPIRALGVPVTHVGGPRRRADRLRAIVRALRTAPVDVVQSQHFYANAYAAVAGRLLGVPSIGALRSDGRTELQANPGLLGWACMHLPTVVAANSLRGIENAVQLGAPRARLVALPNVVDLEAMGAVAPAAPAPDGTVHLVAIGRLVPAKRVDRFLRLVAALRADGAPVRATIVGDGPERDALQAAAATLALDHATCRFAGAADDVRPALRDADVVVLTSDWEGTPNVLLEAMACARPVLATAVGGIEALVQDGRTGLLVPPADEDALRAAAHRLVGDGAVRCALGAAGRAHVEAEYGVPTLARHLGTLYRRVAVVGTPRATGGTAAGGGGQVVMHVTDSLDIGGSERMAVTLANHHARQGRTTHLCTTRHAGRLEALLDPAVARLDLGRCRRIDLEAVRRLARYLRAHDVGVLHAHGTSVFIAAATSLLVPRLRVVWHVHHGRLASRRHAALPYRLVRQRIAHAITASEALATWVGREVGLPAAHVTYVPNCATLAPAPAAPMVLPGRAGGRIVCVATLQPDKDHMTLVRAFATVAARRDDAHLFLVGRTGDARYAMQVRGEVATCGLQGRVSFLGERADVAALLRWMDVGVMASVSEGLPLALLEYGTAALPVVTTDVGQCAAVAQHGAAALVVPPRTPQAMADALLALLDDPDLRDRLAARLHEGVTRHYSIGACSGAVEAVYAAIA